MRVEFEALEYDADGGFRQARYEFHGSEEQGWSVRANGSKKLELGPGYRLLQSRQCGVCSTDLARRFLPFPLPQITGHEVVATDSGGRRYAVEINASHRARQVESDCAFCRLGLEKHCPERLVLGIHDLPGGFGPYILAPVGAVHPLPADLPDSAAALVEPLAAALNAVTTIEPRDYQRIAVLGPRKLGLLVIAALDAFRAERGLRFDIVAVARRQELLDLSRCLGADEAAFSDDPGLAADVVIDTSGSPAGLERAIEIAAREVHVKSTNGQPAAGVEHLTELVVDELNLARFDSGQLLPKLRERRSPLVAWLAPGEPPEALRQQATVLEAPNAQGALERIAAAPPPDGLPRADAAVVASATGVGEAVRPQPGGEASLVRPRGWVLLARPAVGELQRAPLLQAICERDLRLTSSRCGDFAHALRLMESHSALRTLGDTLITDRFRAAELPRAFERAVSPHCIKAIIEHRNGRSDVLS